MIAEPPSRSRTIGAANRSGSGRNGRALLMSHGPTTPGDGTYHVQYSPHSAIRSAVCSCGWQVNASAARPATTTF